MGKFGDVVSRGSCAVVNDVEGRRLSVARSSVKIKDGQHASRAAMCRHRDNVVFAFLPNNVRIVYLDVRKLRWCSVGSIAFHSFAWPRIAREAKSVARTLFINNCHWAGVLVVRGRCVCPRGSYRAANRVLENLLWHWGETNRFYVVYREGSADTGG